MIAHLRGTLLFKKSNKVIIEAAGVGYEVFIPLSTFYEVGEVGSIVALHIYTHVREDTLALYGFQSEREKGLFEKLLSVSGVGPRLAVTILSGVETQDLIAALRGGNLGVLLHIPGVGKKTAERLILELRDKIQEFAAEEAPPAPPPSAASLSDIEQDALSALLNVGYARPNAEAAIIEARKEQPGGDLEQVLRAALRLLSRRFFAPEKR